MRENLQRTVERCMLSFLDTDMLRTVVDAFPASRKRTIGLLVKESEMTPDQVRGWVENMSKRRIIRTELLRRKRLGVYRVYTVNPEMDEWLPPSQPKESILARCGSKLGQMWAAIRRTTWG